MTNVAAHVDTITAAWATLALLSWFARLLVAIPGRLTSWAGFIILFSGVTFMRWPTVYGMTAITDLMPLIRVILYSVVTILHGLDWWSYFRLTEADKIEIRKALDLIERKGKK
jgi:hypothetical protein